MPCHPDRVRANYIDAPIVGDMKESHSTYERTVSAHISELLIHSVARSPRALRQLAEMTVDVFRAKVFEGLVK